MEKIPQDVWPLLAGFLDDKTKRQMRLASTKWFNIIKYNNFKIFFARSDNIEVISERFSKYSWPIELHFFKPKFTEPLDLINALPKITNITKISSDNTPLNFGEVTEDQWMQLSTLTNITDWKLGEYYVPLNLWEKFTNLTEFTMPEVETWTDLAPVVKKMKNLDSLAAWDGGDETWPFAYTYNPGNLTKLNMTLVMEMEHGSEMWAHLTNLKHLQYSDERNNNIASYMSYLTALEYCEMNDPFLPPFTANTNLTNLIFSCMAWSGDNAREISNLTKLKRLGIGVSYEDEDYDDDEEERDQFNFNFLSHLVHLEGCNVSIDRPEKISKEMLCKCLPPSLKYLTLSMDLDLGLLTHLTNLENFANKREVIHLHQLAALSKMTYLMLFQHNIEQDVRSVEKLTQLIQLNFFSWQKQDLDENSIDNLPDLSGLINLKNLWWQTESEISQEKIDNFKYLTGLEELILGTGEESTIDCDFLGCLTNLTALTLDVLTENLECISKLTNLTVLAVNTNNQNQDSFWCGVTALTKLEILRLLYVDNDDRLLGLTALNLTNLAILKAGDNFTGVHFTALTNLHSIFYEPEPDPDENNNSDDDEEYLNVMKNYKPSILQFT